MGLEGVNIVMESEKAFGIDITGAEARVTTTPRLFLELICTKITLRRSESCATQPVFYRLARALRMVLGFHESLAPSTDLSTAVSKKGWPGIWRAIRETERQPGWPAAVHWPAPLFGNRLRSRNVRDLTLYVASDVAMAGRTPATSWTRQEAELVVRRIVADEQGIGLQFNLEASFASLGVT